MSDRDNDARKLADNTANALLNEMDRSQGLAAVSVSAGLDRDFYAREVAAELGSDPDRLKRAAAAVATRPMAPAEYDLHMYAKSAGIDPDVDPAAAQKAWNLAWAEMVSNLSTRALRLVEDTDGPVTKADPLKLLGIALPEED